MRETVNNSANHTFMLIIIVLQPRPGLSYPFNCIPLQPINNQL